MRRAGVGVGVGWGAWERGCAGLLAQREAGDGRRGPNARQRLLHALTSSRQAEMMGESRFSQRFVGGGGGGGVGCGFVFFANVIHGGEGGGSQAAGARGSGGGGRRWGDYLGVSVQAADGTVAV